jgi:hypothetical protein
MFSSKKIEEKKEEVAIALVEAKYSSIVQSKLNKIKEYKEEILLLNDKLNKLIDIKSNDERVVSDSTLSYIAEVEESDIKNKIDYLNETIITEEKSIEYINLLKESEKKLSKIELNKSHDESNLIPKRMKEATDSNFTKEDMKYLLIVLLQLIVLAVFIYIIVKIVK